MAYEVVITHFINPHLFYFCQINTYQYVNRKLEIAHTEKMLNQYNRLRNMLFKPSEGDYVCVFFVKWKRVIRARVDNIVNVQGTEFIVWALDYGFPFQTKLQYIHFMRKEYCYEPSHIKRGGLVNILPAEKILYCGKEEIVITKNWNERACNIMESLLNDCYTVNFEEKFTTDDHYWGELTGTITLDRTISLSDVLRKYNLADQDITTFRDNCSQLSTIQIHRWLTNNNKYMLKHNVKAENHIPNVRELRCNDSFEQDEKEEEEHKILGMSIQVDSGLPRDIALRKYLYQKIRNEADNMEIYENYKDVLPRDALLSLNPNLPFVPEFDNNNTKKESRALLDLTKYLNISVETMDETNHSGSFQDSIPSKRLQRYLSLKKNLCGSSKNLVSAGSEIPIVNKIIIDIPLTRKIVQQESNLNLSSANESEVENSMATKKIEQRESNLNLNSANEYEDEKSMAKTYQEFIDLWQQYHNSY